MFKKEKRYISKDINEEIPKELIAEIWSMIDDMKVDKDYCQVFKITNTFGQMTIVHTQDNPEYRQIRKIKLSAQLQLPIAMKIYVIDDGTHSTMILMDKY